MTDNFENNPILEMDLPDFEEVELISIQRKYLYVIILNIIIVGIMLMVVSSFGFFGINMSFGEYSKWIFVIVPILYVWFSVVNILGFFNRKYAIRDHDVIYQSGFLRRKIVIVPFNRVQHVQLDEGWMSRALELKTVRLYTAGSSDISIMGLSKETAEKINELVLTKIKKISALIEENDIVVSENTETNNALNDIADEKSVENISVEK